MTPIDKIKAFLSSATDISLGYNEINFLSSESLEEEQIGYSFDSNGKSLVTDREGDWKKEWIVIASDQMGDPFLIDTSSSSLTVLSAVHGEGSWEPFVVAESLEKFKGIIAILLRVSRKRSDPVTLERNPITEKERQTALAEIQAANPRAEISFWEVYLEN